MVGPGTGVGVYSLHSFLTSGFTGDWRGISVDGARPVMCIKTILSTAWWQTGHPAVETLLWDSV